MTEIPTVPLGDDVELPMVGFGTYLVPDDDVAAAVGTALRVGYRHVDTAGAYGNETGVGRAIRTALDDGTLVRDGLFVTTKLAPGNPDRGQPTLTTADTLAAFDASLDRLALDHVDLYLVHAPFDPAQRLATWRGLIELREQGRTRSIGVSNFSARHIQDLWDAGLPTPDANQLELHPWSQKPELVDWLVDHGIQPIAYSSLVPLATWRRAPGHASAKTPRMVADAQHSPFAAMADRHGVTEAQVLLRWGIQKGYPVLPKSTDPTRIRENLDLFSFTLDDADMAAIEEMDRDAAVAWPIGDPTLVD